MNKLSQHKKSFNNVLPRMANANKQKGKRVEAEVADMLTEVTGKNWMRVPNSGAFIGGKNSQRIESMSSTQIVAARGDLIPPEEYKEIIVEVKSRKEFAFNQLFTKCKEFESWVEQAHIDYKLSKDNNAVMFVVFKINQKGYYASFIFRDLKSYYDKLSNLCSFTNILYYKMIIDEKLFDLPICKFDKEFIEKVIKK